MQGIAVPQSSVRPTEFFARTRRHFHTDYARTYAGLGQQDVAEIKKTGVLAGLIVRFDGSVTSTPGTGTVATTARWPYDLAKFRFTANGQSNLHNCKGGKYKVREFMARGDMTDRGIEQSIAGVTTRQGTLAQASESWGVGSRATAIGAGSYDVDLSWFIPIAEDQVDLAGAIFAASASTDLTLTIDWATAADLFTLTGNAAASVSGTVQVIALRYAIPLGPDGQVIVPDLSVFHSMIEHRHTDFGTGVNEKRLIGQGAGKTLLRTYAQLWNGSPSVPVVVNEDNFGRMAWRFSGNETPDEFQDGQVMRYVNERMYNSDIGSPWGFFSHEFASENAFRDAVDMGTTSEWRLVVDVLPAVTLTNPALEGVQESLFSAGAGA
jgi:hypothetical protein